MKSALLIPFLFLILALPATGQQSLPALEDGTVIATKGKFRHDGPLRIVGRVKLKGISLDLRGPVSVAAGHAKLTVRNSEIYADWLSLGGDARLRVDGSAVGAHRLAAQRPDLATSQVRLNGHSQATFDRVQFDCGVMAADDSTTVIRNPVTSPKYIRRSGHATVKTEPLLPVEDLGKEM